MDRGLGAQSGHEVFAAAAVDRDDHGDALAYFCEVGTGIVLGWQQCELACRGLDDLLYMTGIGRVAVGIDVNVDILADLNVIDLAFIDISRDRQCIQVGQLYQRQAGSDRLSLYGGRLYDGSIDGAGQIDRIPLRARSTSGDGRCWSNGATRLARRNFVPLLDAQRSQLAVRGCAHGHDIASDLCIIGRVVLVIVVDVVADAADNGEQGYRDQNRY